MEEEKSDQDHLLPDEIKYAIVFHKKEGKKTDKAIARQILIDYNRKIGNSTVSRIWENYQKTKTVSNHWNTQGRPKLLTTDQQEQLIESVRENRLLSSRELGNQLNLNASRQTINRELINAGYHAYRAPQKPLLSDDNIRDRLNFAREHRFWDENEWRQIIFTDESPFYLVKTDGRIFIRRMESEAYQEDTVQFSVSKSKLILVWGAMSHTGVGPLIRVEGTVNAEKYLSFFRYRLRRYYPGLYNGNQKFQDDNSQVHTADIVNNWFAKFDIERLEWPSKSPDLNIIEDIWGYIKYHLRGKTFYELDELWNEVSYYWNHIPQDLINELYHSMPDRIQAVIEARGKTTKY